MTKIVAIEIGRTAIGLHGGGKLRMRKLANDDQAAVMKNFTSVDHVASAVSDDFSTRQLHAKRAGISFGHRR